MEELNEVELNSSANSSDVVTAESETYELPPLNKEMDKSGKNADNTGENLSNSSESVLPSSELEALSVELNQKMEDLQQLFEKKIMHSQHEEKMMDQMHKELQQYKGDLYSQLIRPILMDIIEVRDSISRMSESFLAKPEGEQSIPNKTFSDYTYDLQDILEKNNVILFKSESGSDFVPLQQRILKKVPTDDESLHGKVAESMVCGYGYNNTVLSAEKVSVYAFEGDKTT